MIHDHPWSFNSLIVCGKLINWTYEVGPESWSMGQAYWMRRLKPGIGTMQIAPDEKVVLRQLSSPASGVYYAGDSYYQPWDMVHETAYDDGTITINARVRQGRPDEARVFFRKGDEWVSAEPRRATPDEIEMVCAKALEVLNGQI
jgi:hypothetical protein